MYAAIMIENARLWKVHALRLTFGIYAGDLDESILNALGYYVRHTEYLTILELRSKAHYQRRRVTALPLVDDVWSGAGCLETFDVLDSDLFDEEWVANMKLAVALNCGRLARVFRPLFDAVECLPAGFDRRSRLAAALTRTSKEPQPSAALFWLIRNNLSNCCEILADELFPIHERVAPALVVDPLALRLTLLSMI